MTEQERIENAWYNVNSLARSSDYCRESDHKDIELIESIVRKEIPEKPEVIGDGYADGELVYDTWVCPCCGNHYEIECDDYDYCPRCGQHIDRSLLEEETE